MRVLKRKKISQSTHFRFSKFSKIQKIIIIDHKKIIQIKFNLTFILQLLIFKKIFEKDNRVIPL